MKKQFILLSVLWCSILLGKQHYYVLNTKLDCSGFFSVFHSVLGALDFMETDEHCGGLGIDFETSGLYYDKEYGENWWEYYFEPIDVGDKNDVRYFPLYKQAVFSYGSQYGMPRDRGHALIERYVTIKPHIQEKIDLFSNNHFEGNTVIGIHYRGTDKCHESDVVSYKDAYETVNTLLQKEDESTKIFVATDDADFIAYMKAHLPGKIITTSATRSNTGEAIHFHAKTESNYKKGEESLIDCVLLSRCNIFVKMDSNLGDCVIKFNPHVPIVELNPKHTNEEITPDTCLRITSMPGKQNVFQHLAIALKTLEGYEHNEYKGVTVDFGTRGQYYSPYKGNNWWEYFFEPLSVGDTADKPIDLPWYKGKVMHHSMHEADPHTMHRLIKKYITIKPDIMDEVSEYKERYLRTYPDSFLIGVSYLNNASWNKKPKTPYKELYDIISVHLKENPDTKIFIHTNDKKFHSYLKVKHPDKVFRYDTDEDRFALNADKGKNDLINCLLLSESDQLLCTPSHASLAASWFNPELPITKCGRDSWLEAGPQKEKSK